MKISLLVLITFFTTVSVSIAQSDILGVWYNENKTGKIEIYKKAGSYEGKIIWLEEPIDEKTGKPKLNENAPEKEWRTEPIIGLVILKDFTYNSDKNEFTGGTVYDPENGKTYKAKITLPSKNELDLRGYVGIPAFGRTENWTRTTK